MAISVPLALERVRLVFLPTHQTMLPVTEGSWYHDRLLEGYAV
jgi:hypothetical protein